MQLRSTRFTLPMALVLALAGCGGAQKKTSAAADDCGAVGANMARMFTAVEPTAPATMAADIGAAIERHCRADGWTAQAQDCIAHATDDKGMDACDSMLTTAQKDAVGAEIQAIAVKAMGGAGYGGAGYGGPKH